MKTLIKISMMVAVFSVCAAFAAKTYSPLRARVDTSAVLLGKDASFARLVRITMKDGSVEEFLVESVKTLTFQANPNDSSNIYDDDEEEDPERSDEPDRTPEQQSSGSVTPSSSSVTPIPDSSSDGGKTPSSDSKRGGESSDSVTPSSSSARPDGKSSSSACPPVLRKRPRQFRTTSPTPGLALVGIPETRPCPCSRGRVETPNSLCWTCRVL